MAPITHLNNGDEHIVELVGNFNGMENVDKKPDSIMGEQVKVTGAETP